MAHTPNHITQPSTVASDFGFFGRAVDINATSTLPDILNALFMMALSVGAILAVIRIVYAGYLYSTNDIWSTKSKAKEVAQDAIIGLIILLSVWLILFTINPDILNLNILRSVQPSITPQASYPPGGY